MRVVETCAHCEYDEADGGLVNQCGTCQRKNATRGRLMVGGAWHNVQMQDDGTIRDSCDRDCAGQTYMSAPLISAE